jgi:RNA polymerase sigma-70 factor (ECF subfamily)
VTALTIPPSVDGGLDLVRRHQAGDPDAFAELYRSHYRTVVSFAWSRVHDRQLAEDVAQETFTKAFARLGKFEVRDKAVAAWLITIARNLVADHFKRMSTRRSSLMEVVPEHNADRLAATHAPSADEPVLAGLDRDELLAAMQSLTAHQQSVITLRFFRQMSVAEASEAMGMSEAAVKTAQHRAVQALARHMSAQEQAWLERRAVPWQRQVS